MSTATRSTSYKLIRWQEFRDLIASGKADMAIVQPAVAMNYAGVDIVRTLPTGSSEDGFGRFNLVVSSRWRWLDVDNDRILYVDEIIDAVAKLNPLLGLGGPRRTRIAR